MTSKGDPDSLGFLIADIARLFRAETDRRIAEAGLSLTQGEGRALAHIARAGGVRQTALAERMGVEPMTVTAVVDRLEARGFVRREPDPDDRRAKIIVLTEAADEPLRAIRGISVDIRADLASTFTEPEWRRLRGDLLNLRRSLATLRDNHRLEEAVG